MNFQGNNNTIDPQLLQLQQQQQYAQGLNRQPTRGSSQQTLQLQTTIQQQQMSRNFKPSNTTTSPTAVQRKNMYQQAQLQLQTQQFNLPAVNQSRSERSLENSSGYGAGGVMQTFNQSQRLHLGGALTSRANNVDAIAQLQMLQNQQMMPSNYSNNNPTHLKQSQNEKIKSYSRKLAKLVSSSGTGMNTHSASNSRTPNAKKKIKTTAIGLASGIAASTQGGMIKTGSQSRSGQNTSRGNMNPSMLATSVIYSNGQLPSARSTLYGQGQSTSRAAQQNTTFDMEEHLRNVMRSVERKNRQQSSQPQLNNITSSYLQSNLSQLIGTGNSAINQQNPNVGSLTARNTHNLAMSQLNEYSPEQNQQQMTLAKSPSNTLQIAQNLFAGQNPAQNQPQTTNNKSTIFSNFSNNTYYIGQKKHSHQVTTGNQPQHQIHSLGKKQSYQGVQSSTIMLKSQQNNINSIIQNTNASGSLSRKRGSTKRVGGNNDKNTSSSHRTGLQESVELFSAANTTRNHYQQHYEDSGNSAAAISIRKKRASIGPNNITSGGMIPSNTAYSVHKSKLQNSGAKTQRVNPSNSQYQIQQHQHPRQQLQTYIQQMSGAGVNNSSSAVKKQQNWFSPPPNASTQSVAHINMSNSIQQYPNQQNVLTSIDNNSSAAMNEKTARTSQFVSPRSFLNKSGGANVVQNLVMSAQQINNRVSMGDKNTQLVASYEFDENYNYQQMSQGDWQRAQKLAQLKIFSNFTLKKFFSQWKHSSTKFHYLKKRLALFDNLLQSKSQSFRDHHKLIFGNLNLIKHLSFLPEGGDSDQQKDQAKATKTTLSKGAQFNEALNVIRVSLEKLQAYIVKQNNDQQQLSARSQNSGSLSNRRTSTSINNQDKKAINGIINARCMNYDRLLNLTLTALASSIAQMLIKNRGLNSQSKIRLQVKFQIYGQQLQSTQDIDDLDKNYATHNEYYLTTSPSFKAITSSLASAYEESEQLIFNNRKLIECLNKLNQLFFNTNKPTTKPSTYQWDVNTFFSIIDSIIKGTSDKQQKSRDQIIELVNRDIEEAESVMRRMDDLKQIIQFDERWQTLLQTQYQDTSIHNFTADSDSFLETQALMDRFQHMITAVPQTPVIFNTLTLDFKLLYQQLAKIPRKVSQQIQRKVETSFETTTSDLKQNLREAFEIMKQNPIDLNIYVQMANTVRIIKEPYQSGEIQNKYDSIKRLAMQCKVDNRIIIKQSIQATLQELENYIEHLPKMIRSCTEKLETARYQMEQKMIASCKSLSKSIQEFEAVYIKHFINNINEGGNDKQIDPQQILKKIKSKQKLIDEKFTAKIEQYEESLSIMQMREQFKTYPEITCFEDYKQLIMLHQNTLKLWQILDDWRFQRSSLLQRPILKLNFSEIIKFIDDSLSFLEQNQAEEHMFKSKLSNLSNFITKEMSELQLSIQLIKDLKKECIKKKHWNMIFYELGINQMVGKEDFTLQDLELKYKIYSYQQQIRDIVKLAEQEQDFVDQLSIIKSQLSEKLQFKLVQYKISGQQEEDTMHLISEFDIVQSQLEEFLVILKKGQKSQQLTEVDIKDQFTEHYQKIENMVNVIEKMNDAQKVLLALDAIFSQKQIHQNLPNEGKKFMSIRKSFINNVTGKLKQNPSLQNFSEQLPIMSESLDKIISKATLIQKSLEDYLEAKRLAFPRFFFMTDKQFLEFIELAEQNLDFNKYINLLFPGVSKMFLDQPLQEVQTQNNQFKVPPHLVNDLSSVKSELIDISNNMMTQSQRLPLNRMTNQKEALQMKQNQTKLGQGKGVLEINNSDFIGSEAFNSKASKKSNKQSSPQFVMGMISQMNELFLFEKRIPYQQNKVESWLQGAETNMQETIGKLINFAVNTFPKQSLDEWILDYPQQVILATIHLILTHEINELFEEMRKDKENGNEGGDRRNGSDHGGDSDDDYTGGNGLGNGNTPRTPNTRDLIKNSQISHRTGASQHVSQKSSIRFLRKKASQGGDQQPIQPPRKVSTHEYNSNRGKNNNQSSSNYSSQIQRINNQLQMKQQQLQQNSQYYSEDGGMINMRGGDIGFNHQGEDDFTESELEALDVSRERKKFASNMFGSDFDLGIVAADNKDDTMRILQEKSFRGLYLRLQFWINQICKSLYMSKGSNQDWKTTYDKDKQNPNAPQAPKLEIDLHPVQRLVMQTIINFLSYMRDVVFELKSKKIDNIEDFEWQKQMRLTWNGKDSGCKVDCGAWTTQQANEYFGAKQRIPLTPLTNKYFVFISAAFREKSAVLFRSVPSHDYCSDIFSEFSSICSVPFKEYSCNPKLSMKSLMQFLNGAALASVWIFFEHVDKLDYVHLQTFNKEIQMVQQQFIIAELSQDSSVITAHITVGNQSISQCQRSIERIREQASLESKQQQSKKGLSPKSNGIKIRGGNDIKIEDNIQVYNNHDDFDNEEEEDDDEDLQQIDQQANRDKFKRADLQFNKNNNRGQQQQKQSILQNLSQLDLEEEFNEVQLQEEQDEDDELKLDENQDNTLGGGHSKANNNQNKVCFGVFASISHAFNLKHEKWAVEVSTALQSAFRVLSLTKPEFPVILAMLLKSEGFRDYNALSQKIESSFQKVSSYLNLNERDDSFSLTVRDLKRLTRCCSVILEDSIKQKSKEENSNDRHSSRNQMMTYSMERKSKQQIIKEMEDEDLRDERQKKIRNEIEERVVSYTLKLFLYEKLYSYQQNLKIKDDKLNSDLNDILVNIFGKDVFQKAQNIYNQQQSKSSAQEVQIQQAAQKRGLGPLSPDLLLRMKTIHSTILNNKPLLILGPSLSGKSKALKIILQEVMGQTQSPLYVNPSVMGSYRDLYGVYDPISTTQQVIERQIGPVKHSIFSIMRKSLEESRTLILKGEFDPYFNEALIPILEQQAYREDFSESKQVLLPNGIQERIDAKKVQIIYEMKSIEKVSPRFISAVQVVNMRDRVELKELIQKIKSKTSTSLQKKFQIGGKLVQDCLTNALDNFILQILNSVKVSKHFQSINPTLVLIWLSRSLQSLINGLTHLPQTPSGIDTALLKLALISLTLSLGNSVNYEAKQALDDIITSQLKAKNYHLTINRSQPLFNQFYDYEINDLRELNHSGSNIGMSFLMDNEIIINPILMRASYYTKLMIKNGYDVRLSSAGVGAQKSTIIRYMVKNEVGQQNYQVTKMPMTCFINQKSFRQILIQATQQKKVNDLNKGCLLILDDLNMHADNTCFNILQYIELVRNNKNKIFNPSYPEIQSLSQGFSCLLSSNTPDLQDSKANTFYCDSQCPDYEDFMKLFIQRKVQVQPVYQQQLANILYRMYFWMKQFESSNTPNSINISSFMSLSNLHIIGQLIYKINNSIWKDINLVESILFEYQRVITDRIIFPDLKPQIYENLIKIIKEEIPSSEGQQITPLTVDNLCIIQNGQRNLTKIQEINEFFHPQEYPQPVIKQLSHLYQTIKRPNQHYLYVAKAGSKISDGVQQVAEKLKFNLVTPNSSKYRDSHTFIESINSYLLNALRNQKKYIIQIEDTFLNDLSYIDYVSHLVIAMREVSQNQSLSLFHSLDLIINMQMRSQLVEVARDLYNQQISHSPHSGISSPASPSSLTASITESQLLMNALTKINQNIHFIIRINSLQNYYSYVRSYPIIESLFQVAFIPEFQDSISNDNQSLIYNEIRQWAHDFSIKQVYESPIYETIVSKNDHQFNNEFNSFFIPELKTSQQNSIFKASGGLFDNVNYEKINSDLNLTIPPEYTQSDERFEMFKSLHQIIKQYLYKALANQKQTYQRYFDHYEQLQADFMKKILSKDQQQQVTKNHVLVFNLLNIQEKIEMIQSQLKHKDSQMKLKDQERQDYQGALNKLKEELIMQKSQNDARIVQWIKRLKNSSAQDFKNLNQAMLQNQLQDFDIEIIQAFQTLFQLKNQQGSNFLSQSPQDLMNKLLILNTDQSQVSDQVISKYSKSIQKRLGQEHEKTILGVLARILSELFKKTQLAQKLTTYDYKINQLKEQLSFNQSLIQLYQTQMSDLREEVEDLLIKEKNMKSDLRDLMRRIDLKELKTLSNEHKLKSLIKQGKKSESKLDKVKIRMKNLEGDSLLLACSVVYLGALSLQERMECRKQIAEKLLQSRNIETSEYWQNVQSEQIHGKYFKKVIQNDMELKSQIFNKLNHLFVDSLFSEFLFTYIFSPSTPVIYDSVGIYQQEFTEEILDELNKYKVKVLFSSDYMIQEKISSALTTSNSKGKHQLILINDINDYSKVIQGKSQDQAVLHKLSLAQFNQRVSGLLQDNISISLPVVTLFSANQHFNLNHSYLARATVFNATFVNKNEAWIEIKQILLKHFLPDNYQKLSMIKSQTHILRLKLLDRQKAFDQLFMKVNGQQVEDKNHNALEEIRSCYIDIKQLDEDYQQYNQAFHNLINEHPLLASYSNIFVILYYALKELSKFTEEITYSWKIYTKVIDMIIAKIIRDLTMNLKNKENEESDGEDDGQNQDGVMSGERKKKPKKDKEFTIDEEFFHSVIMPSIYSTIVAGIKQEHVSLFNMIFSMEIALKKTTVNQEDKDFFVQKFFKIKNCYDWRLNPHKPSTIQSGFAEHHQRIKLNDYMAIKRDILKVYPDLRKLFETIEIKIGKEFTYKEANTLLYQKLFKSSSSSQNDTIWKDLPLIKKINVGFLCPDDEWRSKLCQFVYEELTTIFDFTEDLNKLHNFIKTASWSLPVALFTSNSINIVNTVCSIASYYGVGLEVLRTDYQQSIKKQEKYYMNKEIQDNLQIESPIQNDQEIKPLSNEAACIHYEQLDSNKDDRIHMQKQNYQKMFSKDELEIDDKQITQNQSSMQLIEKCAENGTWVLISTLKFPSFWYKISRKLEKMAKKGKVLNTFRLFFDLQGYSLQEIPESFLFNHSVKFYLTEKNNEDMEGFNDVWANILNDDLLNAKDLHNVPVLEPPSDLIKVNLNMESNMYESSMDSLLPSSNQYQASHYKDQINPTHHHHKKTVKDDKITYSMSQYQSKDTIILPQIFTKEHMKEILVGGKDLKSPLNANKPQNINTKSSSNQMKNQMRRNNIEDDISEISIGNHVYSSGLMSAAGGQSILLMEDMSKMEGAFLSELNQAFAAKQMSTNREEEKKDQQPKYEMIKKPAPNHKRQQPPQKH